MPIRLPCTVFPVAVLVRNQMPVDPLAEITLSRNVEFETL